MKTFAKNLKELRKAKGYTQLDLGKILDVSDKTIGSWETGRTEPNMGMVNKICKVLDCKPSQLLGVETDFYIETSSAVPSSLVQFEKRMDIMDEKQLKRIKAYAEYLISKM